MPVLLCLFVLGCLVYNSGQAALMPGSQFLLGPNLHVIDIDHAFNQAKIPELVDAYSKLSTDCTLECQKIFEESVKLPNFQESLGVIKEIVQERKSFNEDLCNYLEEGKDIEGSFEKCLKRMNLQDHIQASTVKARSTVGSKLEFVQVTLRGVKVDLNLYVILEKLLDSLAETLKNSNLEKASQIFAAFQYQIVDIACSQLTGFRQQKKLVKKEIESLQFAEWPAIWKISTLLKPYWSPDIGVVAPQILQEGFPTTQGLEPVEGYRDVYQGLQRCLESAWKTVDPGLKKQVLSTTLTLAQYNQYFEKAAVLRDLEKQNTVAQHYEKLFLDSAWNLWVLRDALMNIKFLLGGLIETPGLQELICGKKTDKLTPEKKEFRKQIMRLKEFNEKIQTAKEKLKAGRDKLSLQFQSFKAEKTAPLLIALEHKGDVPQLPTPLLYDLKTSEIEAPIAIPQTAQKEDPKSGLEFGAAPLGLSENNNNPQTFKVVPEKSIEVKPKISADMIKTLDRWKWIFKAEEMVRDIFTFKTRIDFQEFCGFLQGCGFTVEIDKGGSHGKVTIPKGQSVVYDPASRNLITHDFVGVSFPVVREHGGDKNGKASQLSKLFARQFLSNIGMTPTDIERLEGFVKANKVFGSHAPLTIELKK